MAGITKFGLSDSHINSDPPALLCRRILCYHFFNAYIRSAACHLIRLAAAGWRATFPSRGRLFAQLKSEKRLSEILCAVKIDRQENGFALCLPLEGKVSAEPTDEVFIQILHRLYPDREYNDHCRRAPDERCSPLQ